MAVVQRLDYAVVAAILRLLIHSTLIIPDPTEDETTCSLDSRVVNNPLIGRHETEPMQAGLLLARG